MSSAVPVCYFCERVITRAAERIRVPGPCGPRCPPIDAHRACYDAHIQQATEAQDAEAKHARRKLGISEADAVARTQAAVERLEREAEETRTAARSATDPSRGGPNAGS